MTNEGSRFIVDLGSVKLPPLVEQQVEAEIRSTVLRALAENGFGNNPDIAPTRASSPIHDQFPGRTLGLWPGYPEKKPPTSLRTAAPGPLTVQDHTRIMQAVMDYPVQVIRLLPAQYKSRTRHRPSGSDVLQAALQVDEIDDYVKDRIRAVLDILPAIEESQAGLPEYLKKEVDDLRQQLANRSIEDKKRVLRDPGLRSKYRHNGLVEGMDLANQMLEDGQDSIYSPDHSFFTFDASWQSIAGPPDEAHWWK